MKKIALLPLLVLIIIIGCEKEDSHPENTPFVGTWKCTKIKTKDTETAKEIKPVDCKKCYTLIFKQNGDFVGNSEANEMSGLFKVNSKETQLKFSSIFITLVGEVYDGHLFSDIIAGITSYQFTDKDELILYTKDKNSYLLFKKYEKCKCNTKENITDCPCNKNTNSERIVDSPNGVIDYSEKYGYSILYGFKPELENNYEIRLIPSPAIEKEEQLPNKTKVVVSGNIVDYGSEKTKNIVYLKNYEIKTIENYKTLYWQNVGKVIDIFEIAYGETTELTINNKKRQLKLIDVEDTTIDCSLYDMSSWAADLVRISAFVEIDGKENLRVHSASCSPLEYHIGKDNITNVREVIKGIQTNAVNFDSTFIAEFSNGSILEYPYKLFIAKAYPIKTIYYTKKAPYLHTPPAKEDYKFIFILTKIS